MTRNNGERPARSPAVRWVAEQHDAVARPFDLLAARIGAAPSVRILAAAWAAPLALIDEDPAQRLLAHVSSSRGEMGGLLLGDIHSLPACPGHGFAYLPSIRALVASEQFDHSAVSLRMAPELWRRAAPLLDQGLRVIGWYHSHPDLGAFFSPTDRATQRGFFREPWSLGVVVDPVRGEHAVFVGPEAREAGLEVRVTPLLAPLPVRKA